jgi:hypothetical protein
MGQQQIGLIAYREEIIPWHDGQNKTTGMTAEDLIIIWHHPQANEFLDEKLLQFKC